MKRVLYLAYFFPPLGGAGVQRSLKFARYLPENGWLPHVLTGPSGYWIRDESLLGELDPRTRVDRVTHRGARWMGGAGSGTRRSGRRIFWLRYASRLVLVPDAYVGWSRAAAAHAERLAREIRFDALVTTSSPDSAHLAGARLRRLLGIPWIADFRDPWTRRMAYAPPTPLHHRWHLRLEGQVLRTADRVLVTSDATREDFLVRNPGLPPARVVVIPNGYDESDFVAAESWRATTSGERLAVPALLHAGQLNPERPITPFLAGLRRLRERDPVRAQQARTLFLGAHYDHHREEVRAAGLDDLVRFEGNRPHRESVAALLDAQVLLLLEQNSDRGKLILPGKVWEYARSGRPILGLVPPGGAADRLIRSLEAGRVVDPDRPDEVATAIDDL
ncbi:MAG: glycosyltransferase, partial [Candidatus Eisenbacteria bacterium]|nr:glycosyltransferase [Candidatus Eisenbacteria bacterium]